MNTSVDEKTEAPSLVFHYPYLRRQIIIASCHTLWHNVIRPLTLILLSLSQDINALRVEPPTKGERRRTVKDSGGMLCAPRHGANYQKSKFYCYAPNLPRLTVPFLFSNLPPIYTCSYRGLPPRVFQNNTFQEKISSILSSVRRKKRKSWKV